MRDLQAGEELIKYKSGHDCNTQVGSRSFKKYVIKTTVRQKKTTEASQLPTPLCYGAMPGNVTVGGALIWLLTCCISTVLYNQLEDREKLAMMSKPACSITAKLLLL